jgi:hypothetical protein
MTPCGLVDTAVSGEAAASNFEIQKRHNSTSTLRMGESVAPKHLCLRTNLHGVTFQKAVMFVIEHCRKLVYAVPTALHPKPFGSLRRHLYRPVASLFCLFHYDLCNGVGCA